MRSNEKHINHHFINQIHFSSKILLLLFVCFLLCAATQGQGLEAVIQKGHTYDIETFIVTRDSLYVVTASNDKTAKLWDYKTGRELKTYYHDFNVGVVTLSPDGKQLMTLSEDGTTNNQWVSIWELETGTLLYKYNNKEGVHRLGFGPGYLVIAGYNHIKILDAITKAEINRIELSNSDESLQLSNDGKWAALISRLTGSFDTKIEIYSLPQLKLTYSIPTDKRKGHSLIKFDPFSRCLYSISRVGPFKKIDLATGKVVLSYEKELRDPDNIYQFNITDVSPDGKTIFVGCRDGEGFGVKMWEIESGRDKVSLNIVLEKAVNHITYTPEGSQFIYTTSDSSKLRIIDFKNEHVRSIGGLLTDKDEGIQFFGNTYNINGLYLFMDYKNPISFVGQGNNLIKARFGSKAVMWNASTGKKDKVFAGHKNSLFCYDISQDGKRMVTGGGDGKIILWDIESGDSLKVVQAYYRNMAVMDIHLNPDNEDQVISSSTDVYENFKTIIKIHSLSSGSRLVEYSYKKLVNPFSWNHLVIWGKSDSYLYKATDSTIHLLETRTGQTLRTLQGHKANISSLALSKDKKILISSSWDGTICIWDTDTNFLLNKFDGPKDRVHHAVLSKDGKRLYAAVRDKTIAVWDVGMKSTGWNVTPVKYSRLLKGHQDQVVSLALNADETILASYSRDGTLKFWDTKTNKEFFEQIWFTEDEWIAKVPDGFFYATDEAQKYIHFVDGIKSYSLDQFFNEFYRPDLLPQLFKNRGASSPQGSLQDKVRKLKQLQIKAAISPQTDPGKADLYFKIVGEPEEVKSIHIVHNGKVITEDPGLVQKIKLSQTTQSRLQVDLIGGMNRFKVIVTNNDQVEFSSEDVELFSEVIGKNATCYILSIGINQYKNEKLSLSYAKPDAASFSNLVRQKATLFSKVELIELYDESATRDNILKKFDEVIANAKLEDVFILFYAGHGTMVDEKFYFVPTEATRLYEKQDLMKNAIEVSVIQQKLNAIKALKQLIVMDACQSGSSIETLAVRGAVEEKALAQLSRSAGIHVLASSGSDQFSTEFASLKHGVFTYLILEALQGQADGAPTDGKITIYELKAFLDDQVPELTRKLKGKPQYPHTFSRGQDFPIILNQK
ncbi:MAG: caspase family protein [Bacteroidetes bacterium]|nr:caspase family protein [Bacteroidota bacterium]